MGSNVDAVIAALRVALDEAQKSQAVSWKTQAANRWIKRLPRTWTGKWRHLKLPRRASIDRSEFIGHVRAVIAYLEANRDDVGRSLAWWPRRRTQQPLKPIQSAQQSSGQHSNLLKARKPLPGVH
jgi:hypothetical protein